MTTANDRAGANVGGARVGNRLKDRVVVVTGGNQGLGESIAMACADEGAAGVVICGRNKDTGARVAAALEGKGTRALFVVADLSKVADCEAVIPAADERFGRVDGLVNSAASTARGNIWDTTVDQWDAMFDLNVRAPFILTQAAARVMKREGRGGAIVNVQSQSAHGGQPFLTAYSTSKGALAIFTKNAAHSLRADRIRVNGLNIGWMETPGEHAIQKSDGKPANWLDAEKQQPFGRILRPHDVAGLCVWMLSDDGMMMTGSNVDFDQNVRGAYD